MNATKSIYIGSMDEYSGKTLVCLGIGMKFISEGKKIGYFKPFGSSPIKTKGAVVDEDALSIKQILNISEDVPLICPVIMTQEIINKSLLSKVEGIDKKIIESYQRLAKDKYLTIIDGGANIFTGNMFGMSGIKFIEETGSKVIIVTKYKDDLFVDSILAVKDILGEKLIGIVINSVLENEINHVNEVILPFLKRSDIDVFGTITRDSILNSLSIKEIVEHLGGEIICCSDKIDELVEHFKIGAMSVESALRYFRRVANKAVITGGDRSDIQLAALETPTKCLILTGNLYPDAAIVGKAEEQGVPIIVVKEDTLTTLEKIEKIYSKMTLKGEKKIQRAKEIIGDSFNFQMLKEKIGL